MDSHSRKPVPFRDASGDRLESWKEIAAYLSRDVRTVQRWEHSKGLPIRRLPGGDQARVYALKSELDAWWNSRQMHLISEAEGSEFPSTENTAPRWNKRTIVLTAASLAVLAVISLWWFYLRAPPLPFQRRDWVLITDFDNQTGDAVFDKSLRTAFTVSLEQSRHVNILPRSAIEASLRRMTRSPETRIDEQVGREICQREHVKGLIHCIITNTANEFALAARLVDPQTGVAVRAYVEPARNRDQVIVALGRLAARIRKDLGESLASIQQSDELLPRVTTPSLPALRSFAEGNHLWNKGNYREAVTAWEQALEADSGFVAAHAALGDAFMSHVFNAERAKGQAHYRQALENLDRATDRERLRIRASYEASLGHVDSAVNHYRVSLERYPDDADLRLGLATLLMLHRRHQEAIPEFQQVIRVDPKRPRAWIGLATSYRELNQHADALAAYSKAFALEPGWITLGNLNHEYGFALVTNGDIAKARAVFALALASPDLEDRGLRSLALLDMYEGKYSDAQTRLRRAIALTDKAPLNLARNHLYFAILLGGKGGGGRIQELDRASAALAAWPGTSIWLQARVGAGYARAGGILKAEEILRKVSRLLDPEDSESRAEVQVLEAEIALAKGDPARAVELLQSGPPSTAVPLRWATLARACSKAGDLNRAVAAYGKLIELRGSSLGWEPQQDWLEAHVAIAEIYRQLGRLDDASNRLKALREIWKGADPDLPLSVRLRMSSEVPIE